MDSIQLHNHYQNALPVVETVKRLWRTKIFTTEKAYNKRLKMLLSYEFGAVKQVDQPGVGQTYVLDPIKEKQPAHEFESENEIENWFLSACYEALKTGASADYLYGPFDLKLATVAFSTFKPKSGSMFQYLPEWIYNKKACINIDNSESTIDNSRINADNKKREIIKKGCFLISVISCLYPEKHIRKYSAISRLIYHFNFDANDFPLEIGSTNFNKVTEKFVKDNDLNIFIYGYENYQKDIHVIYDGSNKNATNQVYLL